ncbi:hypothetical protein GCM10010082_07300 [Kushneria pakistanensis]|uniref:5,10-methylene-tetrahydrofolate dehydrogenase n=1 Tax=Kushneria pakistanensis TaxID=1508770 RepID=A0ABQ3FCT8_9GAMM|nr:hypothetical protein GCM10010082_07300 [Kushneria pakistanensis]
MGLIPAPELPELLVSLIIEELSDQLSNDVDDTCQWQLDSVTDPLIGAEDNTRDILSKARELSESRHWDYIICITDLPIFRNRQIVVAEVCEARGMGIISQPALGASPLRRRMAESIVQLVSELHHGSSEDARDREQKRQDNKGRGLLNWWRRHNARDLMRLRLSERVAPIKRVNVHDDQQDIDVRFVSARRLPGACKLLGGMVRANRPWTIFPTFRKIIAVAFATGAYGLIFPTLWRLSDAYEPLRFAALMMAAMIAMVGWIILDHGLWEPQRHPQAFPMARLYNLTTLITLSMGVVFYYVSLLVLFLGAVALFVPSSLLASTLEHDIGLMDYLSLAWLTTSVATVAGALGAGLESDETVRSATYGYRQKARQKRARELAEKAREQQEK